MNLTHLDSNNRPTMVDVNEKDITRRSATASGRISMSPDAYEAMAQNSAKKGPVLQTAVIAAIMGCKKTHELIPMCHPLLLGGIDCNVTQLPELPGIRLDVTVKLSGKTGVEMEALTGVSIGLLTIYDMLKAIDKGMEILEIRLEHKEGGKSGEFRR